MTYSANSSYFLDVFEMFSARFSISAPAISLAAWLLLGWAGYGAVNSVVTWNRLKHIPGPRGAGWSKWWMLRNTLSGNMHLALQRACEEYGPLVRIGPNDLVTSDPDVLRQMWGVRSPYKKGSFYQAVRFDPTKDNIISMRDDQAHNELRAKMAAGYAGKENDQLEATIDQNILKFIDLIENKYLSTETEFRPMDFAIKSQYLTLDVITSLAFGQNFGYVTQDKDVYDYIKITEASMPVMLVLTIFPTLAKVVQSRPFRGLLPSERDRVGFGKFIGVAKQVVADRLASDDPHQKDMLGSFLRHGLTRAEAEGETLVQIIAGSDTTATAVRATLLHLLGAPAAYASLAAEVRQAATAGTLATPATDSQARALPYLQAVIREGLRVHPPVVGLMSTVVPPGGDVLCGVAVPAGTEVGSAAFGVQFSRAVYGADAAVFRPERWLEAKGQQLKDMVATWELIFKYGKWQCLGRSVALIELNKVFIELLRRYDFTLVNPTRPWNSYSAGIFIQSDLWVKITRVHSDRQLCSLCALAAEDIQKECKRLSFTATSTADAQGRLDNASTSSLAGCEEPLLELLARQATRVLELYDSHDSQISNAAVEASRILARLDDLLSIAYAKFYAYVFSELPLWLRELYTDASILKFSVQFRSSTGTGEDRNGLDDMVRTLDMALILAGGAGAARGRGWIDSALRMLGQPGEEAEPIDHPARKKLKLSNDNDGYHAERWTVKPSFSDAEPFTPPIRHPISQAAVMSMEEFQEYMDRGTDTSTQTGPEPLVIQGLTDDWPARTDHPWNKPAYLLSQTLNGSRLVPVEIGRSYVDEGWGQKLMPLRDFLSEYIDPTSKSSHAISASTGYLAQHQLFQQLPSLRNDIRIPDLCYTSPPRHPTDASQDKPELAEPQLNAWFGPASTITPLHTDPYHNLLAQVVGRKYVRLYAPAQSARMRTRGREHGVDMGNTSAWDVGALEGWDTVARAAEGGGMDEGAADEEGEDGDGDEGGGEEQGRLVFRDVPFVDCILNPGDTLYIPIGWWHYVRSLTVSFSVSFWWN